MRTFEPGAYAHIPRKRHIKGLPNQWKDAIEKTMSKCSQASQGNTHPALTRRTKVSVRHPLCREERCKRRHVALTYPTTARNPHTTETPPPKTRHPPFRLFIIITKVLCVMLPLLKDRIHSEKEIKSILSLSSETKSPAERNLHLYSQALGLKCKTADWFVRILSSPVFRQRRAVCKTLWPRQGTK